MITFWSPRRGGCGRWGAPCSFPCPKSPRPGPHRLPHLRSAARTRRRRLQRLGRRAARLLIAGAGPAAGDAGAGAGAQAAGDARLCGSGSSAGRRANSRACRAARGRRRGRGAGGSEAAVPASALRGSSRTREGAARESRARGAGGALRGPGSRSASASRRRREKQQQVLRFSNPFQPLPLHQSAPPERARGRGSLLRWSRVPAAQARPPTRATPGPALPRWGCAPGAPGWGGREPRTTAGARLCPPPSHSRCSQLPTPNWSQRDLPGWAGGGEVGGELCGAHRQWGRLAEPRDPPGKVAKCRLCFSPRRRPRESGLGSSGGARRRETRSKLVSGTQDWLAPSLVSHRPRLPVLCRWLHREEATHAWPLYGNASGEPREGAARRDNAEPQEERRAKGARGRGGGATPCCGPRRSAQAPEGAELASLRDQLNCRGQ